MSLKLAEANVSKDCYFFVKKRYINYVNQENENRIVKEIPIYYTWLGRLIKEKKFQSTTQYCGFYIINSLKFKKIYLWGADYIMNRPILSHFYNFNIESGDKPDEQSIESYNYIRSKFDNCKIIHVCPSQYKSAIFETINL